MYIGRRDGIVRSRADPRLDGRAKTVPFEFADDALQAAVLLEDAIHDRHHAGADDATQQSIEHAHRPILLRATMTNTPSPVISGVPAREHESMCRAAAVSEWRGVRRRLSAVRSCWSDPAPVFGLPRDRSRRQNHRLPTRDDRLRREATPSPFECRY